MTNYKKQIRISQLKVGIVFTTAFAILFLTIIFAGTIGDILKPKATIFAMFSDVKGLREGAPVWFSGIEIGSVKAMEFLPENRIRVQMSISKDSLKYLKRDSRATILTLGLLGDKYIEISPGSKAAEPLKETDVIDGVTQSGFQEIVGTSEQSLAKLTEFIGKLESIVDRLQRGEGTVSKFINDPTVYDNLSRATRNITEITKRLKTGRGTVGRLLRDEEIFKDLQTSARDIKEFALSLKNSEGTLKKLMVDRKLYDRFMKATENIEEFSERLNKSKGTLKMLMEDPELYENLKELSRRLNSLTGELQKSQGLWHAMTKDKELVEELKTTLKELNLLIKDIKEHPKKYFKFSIF